MVKLYIAVIDTDNGLDSIEIEAESKQDAWSYLENTFPDLIVDSIFEAKSVYSLWN